MVIALPTYDVSGDTVCNTYPARGSIPRGETLVLPFIAFILVLHRLYCIVLNRSFTDTEKIWIFGKPTFDSGSTKARTSRLTHVLTS
jgi:hypothetical protein